MTEPRTFFMHEDDDDMIELLPLAAGDYIANEQRAVEDFAREHAVTLTDGTVVYSDIYLRKSPPQNLRSLDWPVDDFVSLLPSGWPSFAKVLTGYSTHREEPKGVRAFGDPEGCVVRVAQDGDGFVTAVDFQLYVRDDRDAELLTRTLAGWTARQPLLLADWWRSEMIDLTNPAQVRYYVTALRLG